MFTWNEGNTGGAPLLRKVKLGEFEQGVVFNGAKSYGLPGRPVHALLITARCDTANGKAGLLNYIPLIPFPLWLREFGCRIACERDTRSIRSQLENVLKEASIPLALFGKVSSKVILNALRSDQSKSGRRRAERYRDLYAKYCLYIHILETKSISEKTYRLLLNGNTAVLRSVIADVIANKLSDCHYILHEDSKESWVALFREIQCMPSDLGELISNGLEKTAYDKWVKERSGFSDCLLFAASDDFSLPLYILESPYVELLMQRLSLLFIRIGVQDRAADHADRLLSECKQEPNP